MRHFRLSYKMSLFQYLIVLILFGHGWKKIGLLFVFTSGHTGYKIVSLQHQLFKPQIKLSVKYFSVYHFRSRSCSAKSCQSLYLDVRNVRDVGRSDGRRRCRNAGFARRHERAKGNRGGKIVRMDQLVIVVQSSYQETSRDNKSSQFFVPIQCLRYFAIISLGRYLK